MTLSDAIGYFASALVLAAFCMKDIVPLRLVALCSNVAFLVYGVNMGLVPIWLLHGLLLAMNGWRLAQALLGTRTSIPAEALADRSPPIEPAPVRKRSKVFGRSSAVSPQSWN